MNTSVEAAGKHRLAWRFILLVGITNLFADMTYEGARGVNGAFLGQLGAIHGCLLSRCCPPAMHGPGSLPNVQGV